jgi:hypothetical protein
MFELPEGYIEIKRLDFIRNKKTALAINLAAGGVFFAAILIGGLAGLVSLEGIYVFHGTASLLFLLVFLVSMIAFAVVHELIHGAFIKKYSGKRARIGFTRLYAYAASDAYFNKRQYLIIAFAPVVILGAALLALNIALPPSIAWFAYLMQCFNLSSACGDFYVAVEMKRAPADVLTHDEGTDMILYSKDAQGASSPG